jgi:hypothetical protein
LFFFVFLPNESSYFCQSRPSYIRSRVNLVIH